MAKYRLSKAALKDLNFDVLEGLYFRRCNKHFIFYRFANDGKVEIIRILHKMMDIESKF